MIDHERQRWHGWNGIDPNVGGHYVSHAVVDAAGPLALEAACAPDAVAIEPVANPDAVGAGDGATYAVYAKSRAHRSDLDGRYAAELESYLGEDDLVPGEGEDDLVPGEGEDDLVPGEGEGEDEDEDEDDRVYCKHYRHLINGDWDAYDADRASADADRASAAAKTAETAGLQGVREDELTSLIAYPNAYKEIAGWKEALDAERAAALLAARATAKVIARSAAAKRAAETRAWQHLLSPGYEASVVQLR